MMILKQVKNGLPVSELCREYGISSISFTNGANDCKDERHGGGNPPPKAHVWRAEPAKSPAEGEVLVKKR
jgi:hypothetical protein